MPPELKKLSVTVILGFLFGIFFLIYENFIEPSALHGSWHWYLERVVAVGNASFLGAMIFSAPNAIVDFGLTFTLPLHAYLGMGAIITDYLPQRKFPYIFRVVKGSLILATGLTVYGFYKFNTDNIGFSAFVKKLWIAKEHQGLADGKALADE